MNETWERYSPSREARLRRRRRIFLRRRILLGAVLLLMISLGIGLAVGGMRDTPISESANSEIPAEMDALAFNPNPNAHIVAIDAGHGGKDPGSVGLLNEVELTETTATILYELLSADENFAPMLCRENGEFVEVKDRPKRANAMNAELFISIHGNSDTDAQSNGFECFPKPPGRDQHANSLAFAEMIARQMGTKGARLRGEGGLRYAYFKEDGSRVFREINDDSVYDDPSYGVLEEAACPAVLVEQGFITNDKDMELFGGEAGCRRAAEAYYRAICDYFKTTPIQI